jgi:hypothetical protein
MATSKDWLASNANEWRRFLAQSTGLKVLDYARNNTPQISSKEMEAVALEAYRKQGWEECLDFLLRLTEPPVGPDEQGIDHVDIAGEPD